MPTLRYSNKRALNASQNAYEKRMRLSELNTIYVQNLDFNSLLLITSNYLL